jgi:UDP-N-acetylmuramate--alanine ligase
MSAVARYFSAMGKEVVGYDKTPSPLTDTLMDEGIPVFFDDEQESIPPHFQEKKDQVMVVYTPAIPEDNQLLNHVREGLPACWPLYSSRVHLHLQPFLAVFQRI